MTFYLLNLLDLLDVTGEWYLEHGSDTVHYMPRIVKVQVGSAYR